MSVTSDKAIVQNRTKLKMTRMYFAVMRQFGYEPDEAKSIAKKKFKVEHFGDLDTQQMADILNEMEENN